MVIAELSVARDEDKCVLTGAILAMALIPVSIIVSHCPGYSEQVLRIIDFFGKRRCSDVSDEGLLGKSEYRRRAWVFDNSLIMCANYRFLASAVVAMSQTRVFR